MAAVVVVVGAADDRGGGGGGGSIAGGGNRGLGECILIIFCWGVERERRGWCQWECIL